jgi:ribonuclease HI
MYHFKSDDTIICFTDGSCINNGKLDAVGGYGAYFPYHQELNFSSKIDNRIATNNIAELLAILEAIKKCTSFLDLDYIKKLLIYTDSKYCFKIFTEWIFTWKKIII